MLQTNRTPFTDVCSLIAVEKIEDSSRHYTVRETGRREIFCSFRRGVVRSEFYDGLKAGVKLSATVAVWEAEYEGEELLEHEKQRYRVVRTFPLGDGTLELSCEEVTR